jgi:hypothetical protein
VDGRRLVVSVGTAHYAKVEDADLPAVPDNVDRIAKCFVLLGYERADVALNPTRNELRDVLSRIFADAQPNDKIVFYYTGHGEIKGGQILSAHHRFRASLVEWNCS